MNETIITIQGQDITGKTIADRFYTTGKVKTRQLIKAFGEMYHLSNVVAL